MWTRILIPAYLAIVLMLGCSQNVFVYHTSLPEKTERYWIGPELWANRLQDWHIKDGRIAHFQVKLKVGFRLAQD